MRPSYAWGLPCASCCTGQCESQHGFLLGCSTHLITFLCGWLLVCFVVAGYAQHTWRCKPFVRGKLLACCAEQMRCVHHSPVAGADQCALCCVLYCRWGGICCAPNPSVTEERFYLSEYSNAERAAGAHLAVLAFAHESHRERDPHGWKGCGRDGCSSVLPRMQLPCTACCCCLGQSAGPSASRSSSGTPPDAQVDAVKPGRQAQAQGCAQSATQAAVQMVPIDAACSTNGSSTGRGSGSSHGGRHFLSSLAPHATPPALQGVRR